MFFLQKARTRKVEPVHENGMQSTSRFASSWGVGLFLWKAF